MTSDTDGAGPPLEIPPDLPSGPQVEVLLHVLPCGVLIEDERGRATFTNEILRAQFDLDGECDDPQGSIGGGAADPLRFEERVAGLRGTAHAVTEDVAMSDGRIFERDYLPVIEGGRRLGQVWTYWDFTERKRAEQARERGLRAEILAQRVGVRAHRARADEAERSGLRLAETDTLRQRLMATASHELRTPLTSISSFAELLADDVDGDAAEFVSAIRRNAGRMLVLVDDLLLLARLQNGVQVLDYRSIDLVGAARECALDLSAASGSPSSAIEVDADGPVQVNADHAALSQIVMNLLGNAVKYSDGDAVDVRVDEVDGMGRIVIRDRGIGIPEEDLARVFEQFFRSAAARRSGRAGSGLGLAVVRGLVDSMGGEIVLESAPGVGTTVDVRLPLA